MKVLIGVADVAPGGFCHVDRNEMVWLKGLVCKARGCGCDRSWSGIHSTKGATVARVIAPPLCFNLKPELAADPCMAHALALADKHPTGTLLRATYSWSRSPGNPQDLIIDRVAEFLASWDITIIGGPN